MFHTRSLVPTILVVDDSDETVQIVRYALQNGGFRVRTAHSGEEALAVMTHDGLPHLIIADLHMPPGMSGFDLCRAVSRWCDVPVIMLTAIDEAETMVTALEQFVEDYIVKPFAPHELLARVRRVLQRIGVFPYEPASPLAIDEYLSIIFPERTVHLQQHEISLTPTETKLMYLLLRRPGETIPYDYLLRRMWPREMVFEDRLHVFVHRLRNKLIRDRVSHQYVVLERGIGYCFSSLPSIEPEFAG